MLVRDVLALSSDQGGRKRCRTVAPLRVTQAKREAQRRGKRTGRKEKRKKLGEEEETRRKREEGREGGREIWIVGFQLAKSTIALL